MRLQAEQAIGGRPQFNWLSKAGVDGDARLFESVPRRAGPCRGPGPAYCFVS
jgi:hypothetical protein